jgi:hypothetical protein
MLLLEVLHVVTDWVPQPVLGSVFRSDISLLYLIISLISIWINILSFYFILVPLNLEVPVFIGQIETGTSQIKSGSNLNESGLIAWS